MIRVYTPPVPPNFENGDKPLKSDILEKYLQHKIGETITIRYQNYKKGSAKHWRDIKMSHYDDEYIYAMHEDGFEIRYRRDRVVEFSALDKR